MATPKWKKGRSQQEKSTLSCEHEARIQLCLPRIQLNSAQHIASSQLFAIYGSYGKSVVKLQIHPF
jgi:hypothetical protein